MAKREQFLLLLSLRILATSSAAVVSGNSSALFIFGDSFLDAGNNNYLATSPLDQANFWPYGETYFGFPTGRFSDGRLISDFIAEFANLTGILPYLLPGVERYRHGVNFASGGAGALAETFAGDVIDLRTQLTYFRNVEGYLRKNGNASVKLMMSRAVFLFSIGSNDYLSKFLMNSSLLNSRELSEYVGIVVGNVTHVVKEIYGVGGRKFGMINLPPLGCTPMMRLLNVQRNGTGCFENLSLLASLHNKVLSRALVTLEKKLKGFKYSFLDMNHYVRRMHREPSKYGFKDGSSACCGGGKFRGVYSCGGKRSVREFELCEVPSDHVFWDSIHLTEKAYQQLAAHMWREPRRPPPRGPRSLRQLFVEEISQ